MHLWAGLNKYHDFKQNLKSEIIFKTIEALVDSLPPIYWRLMTLER